MSVSNRRYKRTMTQRRVLSLLETRVERGEDVAADLQLRDGDQVTLDVAVQGAGTATLGLYHASGSLFEDVLAGRGRRRLELQVPRDSDTSHLLFCSARDTAVDIDVTVMR